MASDFAKNAGSSYSVGPATSDSIEWAFLGDACDHIDHVVRRDWPEPDRWYSQASDGPIAREGFNNGGYELEELGRTHDRVWASRTDDHLFLRQLARAVASIGAPPDADYRQHHMATDTGRNFLGQKMSS